MNRKSLLRCIAILMLVALITGCGGPEAKKAKYFKRGTAFYEKGDYVKARLEFKNVLQIAPRFAEALYMLGMIEFQENNWRGAFGYFSKVVDLDPNHLKAHLKLGRIFLGVRDPDKAMAKAELVLKAEPKNEDALLLKGAVYLARKDLGKGISYLEELKAQGMRNPELFLMVVAAYRDRKVLKKAEDALLSGIHANPKSVLLHLTLADFYTANNRPEDAVPILQAIIRLEPEQVNHRFALAGLLWDMGKTEQSSGLLNEIRAQLKGDECWVKPARFYLAKGKTEAAEEELKKGLANNAKSFTLRFALSDLYQNTGRVDKAMVMLKECLALSKDSANPGVLQAKNGLARIHLARRQVEEAETYIREILTDSPKDVTARFQKGTIHLLRGEGSDAIMEFRTVLNENPRSIPAHLRLAEAHAVNGEVDLAADTLQSALKEAPDSVEVHRAIGRLYAVKNDFQRAEDYLRKLKTAYPQDLGVMEDLADLFLVAQDLKRAEAGYQEIKRKAPYAPSGYQKLGRLYLAQGESSRAIPELQRALQIFPQSEELKTLLVEAYARQGKYGAALALCDEWLKEDPGDPFSWNLKGDVCMLQKNYPSAEEAFKNAIRIRPLWSKPHTNLAQLLLLQGKADEAAKMLEKAVKADPENLTLSLALGKVYYQKGDHRKATGVYEKLLEKKPSLWVAANDLAFIMSEQAKSKSDFDRALQMVQKARNIRPEEASVMDTLGWVYYKTGDVTQALEWIRKAWAKIPADPTVNYHMGMACFQAGKPEEARKFLRIALAQAEDFSGRQEAQATMKRLGVR